MNLDQIKQQIKSHIINGLIKNSKGIWKMIPPEYFSQILDGLGKNRSEKLYLWLYDNPIHQCKQCLNTTKFHNFFKGYQIFCSPKCSSDWFRANETLDDKIYKNYKIQQTHILKSSEEKSTILEKRNKTKFEKYGSSTYNNPEKNKQTMLLRYGYKHPLQVPTFNSKFKDTLKLKDWTDSINLRENTLLQTTGFKHQLLNPKIKNKIKNTNLKKYGFENPSQVLEFANKKVETHLQNYGVSYPAQHPETFHKQRVGMWKLKDYLMPNGTIVKLQGYEHFELTRLLSIYAIDEIIINNSYMPEIWYFGLDDKKHRYYPDFYIPKDNLIIEVKSGYTMHLELTMNKLKRQRCIDMGFDFQFKIYTDQGILVDPTIYLLD